MWLHVRLNIQNQFSPFKFALRCYKTNATKYIKFSNIQVFKMKYIHKAFDF